MKLLVVMTSLLFFVSCAKTKFQGVSGKATSAQTNPTTTTGEKIVEPGKTDDGKKEETPSLNPDGKPNTDGPKATNPDQPKGGNTPKSDDPKNPSNPTNPTKPTDPKTPTDGPTKGQTLPVVKVGINFEDMVGQPGNDSDYNDVVLCFQGNFDMTDTVLVSQKDQTVTATAFSEAGCKHTVEVIVKHADGSMDKPITYDSHSKTEVPLSFKKGDSLEVFMTPNKETESKCKSVRYTMHDKNAAKAKPNLCNNR